VTTSPLSDARLRELKDLRRVKDRIDREYAQPLEVESLARGVHMSPGHLSRRFKAAYQESPYSYLMTRRIERAMALLRRGDLSVTEVCFANKKRRFQRRASPPVWQNRSPDRSGIEKRPRRSRN
jgi:AraC-like DNA-binding protein